MAGSSFDIVSRIDLHEVNNAIQQAGKELRMRFDLKNTKSEIELDEAGSKIVVRAPDQFTLRSVREVLEQKLVRRGVPMRGLTFGNPQPAVGSSVVQEIGMQHGIPVEKGREIVKLIKGMKRKVQASIQADQVRVSGKKRDDLQNVIAKLKDADVDLPLQFVNFRD